MRIKKDQAIRVRMSDDMIKKLVAISDGATLSHTIRQLVREVSSQRLKTVSND